MRISVLLLAIATVVACSTVDAPRKTDTTAVSRLCEVTVVPASAILQVGDALTFTAPKCTDGGVTWASSAPDVATVDSATGLVRAVKPGTASIIATSKIDPTVKGAGVVIVGSVSSGPQTFLDVQTVNEVGPPSTPANLSSVNGTIDVALSGGSTIPIRELRLIANDGARDITVASDTTRIAPSRSIAAHLFWNTAAKNVDGSRKFANGTYRLSAAALDSTGSRIAVSTTFQVTVANP